MDALRHMQNREAMWHRNHDNEERIEELDGSCDSHDVWSSEYSSSIASGREEENRELYNQRRVSGSDNATNLIGGAGKRWRTARVARN